MSFNNTLAFAQQSDQDDPLRSFRDKFIMPDINGKQQTYFLGNSLGLQPHDTKTAINEILDQWASYGVEGFFMGDKPWMHYHDQLTPALSSIVGALPHEITVMNQLTVNLHMMMVSFYRPQGKRIKIICEAKAFPSDQYMFETHIKHHGFNPDEVLIEVGPRAGSHLIELDDILAAIEQHKDELALVLWGGVNYYTGQVFDMKAITDAAHVAGALAGFDLAHAAGNIPLQLHDWNVDFACWCSYKYLNSGPGGVGGAYVHERYHNDASLQRFAGWWGYRKDTRFKMNKGFQPAPSAEGWQLSTPSMLLYACHKAALNTVAAAGWDKIQEKRKKLNNYLWYILDEVNLAKPDSAIEFITPRDEAARGSQVSMLVKQNGRALFDALTEQNFIVDWREPNVIRIAPVPLYNSYEEVWQFGEALKRIL